jgi:serine phosphatase RsbU (regulator of sigma subunit)/Tfp pilus assembly protein PilF
MKLYISILIFIALSFSISKKGNSQDFYTMDFHGKVLFEGEPAENVIISISQYGKNNVLDEVKTQNKGTFEIGIEPKFNYVLEISKKGYITQKVYLDAVDVWNQTVAEKSNIPFDMGSFTLFKPGVDVDKSLFEDDILSIVYKKANNRFVIEKDDRDKIYNNIETYIKNKKEYKELLTDALKFYKAKNYNKALPLYEKASNIFPNEPFPKEKINEINSFLAKADEEKEEKNDAEVDKEEESPITETIDKKEVKKTNFVEPTISTNDYKLKLEQAKKDNDQDEICSINKKMANLYIMKGELNVALDHLNESLAIAIQKNDKSLQADVLSDIAVVQFDSGKFDNSLEYLKKALELKKSLNDKEGSVNILSQLAQTNNNLFRQETAIEYYNDALEIAKETSNEKLASSILDNIGNIYYDQNQFDKAIESYKQSLEIEKKLGNEENVAVNLNNIGIAYYDQGNFEKAEEYYENSLNIFEEMGDQKEMSISLNNIGNVNYDWEKYVKALDYYEKSLKIKEELGYQAGIATSLFNIGNIQVKMNNNKKAVDYYNKSIEVSNEIEFNDLITKNLYALSLTYKEIGNVDKAFEFYEKYAESKYSFEKYDPEGQVSEMMSKVKEKEKKSAEIISQLKEEISQQKLLAELEAEKNQKTLKLKNLQLLQKEQKISFQKTINILALIGILLIGLYSIMLLRQFRLKKKANIQLAEQKSIAEEQRDQIATQKREITDSINYAQRIQNAVLPSVTTIEKLLPEHFILFRPKDIVSGDFYWTAHKDDKIVFAVSDCTGHGVPGGFMSMLGISFLNEIVSKDIKLEANYILNELREFIIQSLHQTGKDDEAKDGMDIALCIFDKTKNELQYAGANNPMYLIRNGELEIHKANKMPIGIHTMDNKPFQNNSLQAQKGDIIYLFSDGYIDQFGGPNQKKFSSKQFRKLLLDNHKNNLKEQKLAIEVELDNWMKETEQIDDICVMGIKLS